jgi:hypothetical protein
MPVYTVTNCTSTTTGNTHWVYPAWTTGATTLNITASTSTPLWVPDQNGIWQPWPGVQVTSPWGFSYDYSGWSRPAPEQVAARAAERVAEAQAYEERMRRRARVNDRAEELLLSLLSDDQCFSYTQNGWFEVRGSAGGLYRINRRGQAGNVDELPAPGAPRIASYCIHPAGNFPDADAHAAQYLALVTDEDEFRRVANRTPRYRIPAAA